MLETTNKVDDYESNVIVKFWKYACTSYRSVLLVLMGPISLSLESAVFRTTIFWPDIYTDVLHKLGVSVDYTRILRIETQLAQAVS